MTERRFKNFVYGMLLLVIMLAFGVILGKAQTATIHKHETTNKIYLKHIRNITPPPEYELR